MAYTVCHTPPRIIVAGCYGNEEMVFFTPNEYRYHQMDDYDVSVAGQTSLKFQVRACNDVYVLLMATRDDFLSDIYEIAIGELQNTRSTIRKAQQGDNLGTVDHAPLHCHLLRDFWVSWVGGVIKAGTGMTVGMDEFLSFAESTPTAVNFLGVSTGIGATGHWKFLCSNRRDCQDIFDSGTTTSGMYKIKPSCDCEAFYVYCDMTTDGGGWTVFQRRQPPGTEDFYLDWEDYETGFGDVTGEHWLGLKNIHAIVSQDNYELRVDLTDLTDDAKFAKYGVFNIGPKSANYKLTVGNYDGTSNAGDSLGYHNGYDFSTKDVDNDVYSSNCAMQFEGAWWYRSCHHSNLNGRYLSGPHASYANGVNWRDWQGYHYSLKTSEMKVRRQGP